MNIINVLNQITRVDEDAYERITSRRAMFGAAGKIGKKAALAALATPVALGATIQRAYAGTQQTTSVIDVLNFALTLEYLEAEFYNNVTANTNLVDSSSEIGQILELIALHENQHVAFLQSAITAAGGTPADKPTFDFTAGGLFPAVADAGSDDLPTFLAMAQAFEDTGVRAYKGGAPALMSNKDILTAALQIHSVEARHASEIRRYRGSKGWIVGDNNSTGVDAVNAVYAGEDNTSHTVSTGTFDVTSLSNLPGGVEAITESYDEPLSVDAVLAIVDPFIVD
jgi:rubrerythrin